MIIYVLIVMIKDILEDNIGNTDILLLAVMVRAMPTLQKSDTYGIYFI